MARQKGLKFLISFSCFFFGLFCFLQPVSADEYFIVKPSVPCIAVLEREFGELLRLEDKQVALRKNSPAIQEKFKFGFHYFANLKGQTGLGSIHQTTADDDIIMVIPDKDLPCRTIVSVASRDAVAGIQTEQQLPNKLKSNPQKLPVTRQIVENNNSSSQKTAPEILIESVSTEGKQGTIQGRVLDVAEVAELAVDGSEVYFGVDGKFEFQTFVPVGGVSVKIEATNSFGITTSLYLALERPIDNSAPTLTFARLNPLGKPVVVNEDALAFIIGVANYENTSAKAVFANSDALMFKDYASEKLGIPENRINTLVDEGADIRKVLLGVKNWLSRAIKRGQSDVYIFFAGHGLASDDGEQIYLLPYDGTPELLEKTAILRDELFNDIADANPRSVTVFLDTCYSGAGRGEKALLTARPVRLVYKPKPVPQGFTVMTAAAGDQTAKPLGEAKHGMFSYFLMKGMEGDADANKDNQITAGELYAFVQQNVIQQSSGSQTPELQGDADRVLVRFQ